LQKCDARRNHGEIRERCTEDRRVGHASTQERIAQERAVGAYGQKPQAGDRNRPERGPREGAEGAVAQALVEVGVRFAQAVVVAEALVVVAVGLVAELIVRARRNGHGGRGPIRYAVVGLGHIAQVAVLPAFAHATKNSQLTALVSNDAKKLKVLSKRYGIAPTFSYREFDECLRHVDAVYIALPNSMHREYTIRAARAGVHVLCEKPMAVTVDECEEMIDACRTNHVSLMIAYRLHFEEINLAVIDIVRRGRIGTPKFFNSSFAMRVSPGNIRTRKHLGGGTLYDIGVYCINAARYLFRGEPTEVMAISVNAGQSRLREIDESTGAVLRFEGERVATFVTSFNAADVGSYRIVGTRGQLHVDPAYEYAEGLAYELTVDGKTTRARGRKRDQFASELIYFSDCILNDREPEPSGEEGLQDVRIIQALYQSAETGHVIKIRPNERRQRPTGRQRILRPPVKKPSLVNARGASQD
jgi:glucose-fructose oxidoreductase